MSLAALREANRLCLRRGRGAALPFRPRARRRRAGGRLPRDLAGAGRVRAPVGAAAARPTGATARSTCSAKPGCRSRAATPTSASPSRRRSSAQSRVALLAAVGRRVGDAGLVGPARRGPRPAARHAAAIERIAEALVRQPRRIAGRVGQRRRGDAGRGGEAERASWATPARPSILARPSLQRQGDDTALPALIDDMNRGTVHALLLWGANPVYDHPDGVAFGAALGRSRCRSRSPIGRDETSAHVHAVCPDHHFLEAWGDAEPVSGHFSLRQPLIAPLHDTRAAEESLLTWAGRPTDQRTHLRAFWKRELYPRAGAVAGGFEGFWERALERGVIDLPRPPVATRRSRAAWQDAVARHRVARQPRGPAGRRQHGYELALARDRRRARRPPRQQPVAAGAARSDDAPDLGQRRVGGARDRGGAGHRDRRRRHADVRDGPPGAARVRPGGPAAPDDLGRRRIRAAGPPARPPTASVATSFPLARVENGARRYSARVTIAKTGRRARLAPAQTHFSMEGRDIVQTIDHSPRPSTETSAPANTRRSARSCRTCGESGCMARTPGGCRSISTRARAARPASSPASPRTTSRSSARDRCARAGSCTGCASTVTSRATGRTPRSVSTSR